MANNIKLYYKTCREQAGLTQEQAIVLLGIAETTTLSKYENGHLPVSPELAVLMVRVYHTPLLANWYVRYTNPGLAQFLPEINNLITDGDTALQMELADDDITEVRKAIKAILRDGIVTEEEAQELKVNAKTLRDVANKILSAATYLECRESD